jgi:hypothetical protein
MSFFGGMDSQERDTLHELISLLLDRLDTQRRLAEDLTRQLEAERERLAVLEALHYGLC